MHFKRRFFPLGVSSTCNHSKHGEQRHLAPIISAFSEFVFAVSLYPLSFFTNTPFKDEYFFNIMRISTQIYSLLPFYKNLLNVLNRKCENIKRQNILVWKTIPLASINKIHKNSQRDLRSILLSLYSCDFKIYIQFCSI